MPNHPHPLGRQMKAGSSETRYVCGVGSSPRRGDAKPLVAYLNHPAQMPWSRWAKVAQKKALKATEVQAA